MFQPLPAPPKKVKKKKKSTFPLNSPITLSFTLPSTFFVHQIIGLLITPIFFLQMYHYQVTLQSHFKLPGSQSVQDTISKLRATLYP